LKDLHEIKFE
jgi:DNA topoisomerase-2